MRKSVTTLILLMCIVVQDMMAQPISADYQSANQFEEIPPEWIASVKDFFGTEWPPKIFFGTRSHGSQLLHGLEIIEDMNQDLLTPPAIQQQTGLAGQFQDGIFWADATRQHLQSFPDTKMIIWAMCRTITGTLTEQEVSQYLNDMGELEAEFPEVFFVYWTDIIAEDSPNNEVDLRNNQIREFCQSNNKILFDFASITAHTPEGDYFPGTTEGGCTWCDEWCINHNYSFCSNCSECPHSVCFDCYRKGKAFWWLLAKVVGWDSTPVLDSTLEGVKGLFR